MDKYRLVIEVQQIDERGSVVGVIDRLDLFGPEDYKDVKDLFDVYLENEGVDE